ncbi:MAG: hypothetical protein OEY86_01935 [Nitrospira sp.]|nr:hypothetical protein [Nitrospira sp.]
MRFTWRALVTTLLVLGPLNFEVAATKHKASQELEASTTIVLQKELDWLRNKLNAALVLDKEKAYAYARVLGFNSLDELQNAHPDVKMGLPVYYIRLDTLRAYTSGNDPWPLLKQTNTFLYPIVVPGKNKESIQIRSAAMVHIDADEKDKTIRPHLSQLEGSLSIPIRVLSEARESILAKFLHCDYFVISIPALQKRLLGLHREGSCDFNVIDLSQGLEHSLKNDSIRSAKEAFTTIAEDARSDKYDMPMERE